MNKKETKKLDKLIGYLSGKSHRVQAYRKLLGINPHYNFTHEARTIESLYMRLLEERKKTNRPWMYASSSGWTVEYIRNNKKYKDGEKYWLKIYFSFVEEETLD